ncbi:MAG: 2-amino-4-hydroxy-6-hydroxymethyldihydropteridine diphosphokinase [Candidatus Portnoybacteria bacterium]|nr:2-amino-4-hydroxy-6-hydroxymethyldihydropteridine diphosphokinase [Candidatus Portnoybacteria bacterium]
MPLTYLGLGSNEGESLENIKRAIGLLEQHPRIFHLRWARFYRTSPVGYKEQDWFTNTVVEFETDLSPPQLLAICQNIEVELGRVKTIKWGPRTIDLDILFYGDEVIKTSLRENFVSSLGSEINTNTLQIPHPQLHLRKFVLVPLVELNKDFFHPIFKKTVTKLLEELTTDDIVIPIPELR